LSIIAKTRVLNSKNDFFLYAKKGEHKKKNLRRNGKEQK